MWYGALGLHLRKRIQYNHLQWIQNDFHYNQNFHNILLPKTMNHITYDKYHHIQLAAVQERGPGPYLLWGTGVSHPHAKILSVNHQISHFCQQVFSIFWILGTQEDDYGAAG